MATSSHTQNALLTEHFRYTPLTLLDDIINVVNELIFRAINAIDEGLANIPAQSLGFKLDPALASTLPTDDAKQDVLNELKETEIGNGVVALESLLNATVDRDFDKFEIYCLRNILAIGHEEKEAEELSKWIRLEHYRDLDLDAALSAPKPEEVLLQRRKLQESMKLNSLLKAERARNATVLEQLNGLMGVKTEGSDDTPSPFAFLATSEHTSMSEGSRPLEQNVHYALSQLPALRHLLQQLKASLQTLPHARQDDDSREAKRRQYLDGQARRAMERKGVEADRAEEIAAASSGRKIGRDEVEGMEAVVQALGGAPAPRRSSDEDTDD